jgi:hypothetical protein
MANKTVYDLLLAFVKEQDADFEERTEKETDQKYLARMMTVISEADEEVWNGLDEDAQSWFNDAAIARKKRKDVDLPDGYEAAPVPEKAARKKSGAEALAETTAKKAAGKKAAAPAKKEAAKKQAAPAKKAAAKKEAAPKKAAAATKPKKELSAAQFMRQLVIKKHNITNEEVAEKVAAKFEDISAATIAATAGFTRSVIRDMIEMGVLSS